MADLKKYKLKRVLFKPKSYSSEDLFEFCVNILVQKLTNYKYPLNILEGEDSIKGHNQWASLIFKGDNSASEYLSIVKNAYSSYFDPHGRKYRWLLDKIFEEHPEFFEGVTSSNKNLFEEMLNALDDELEASRQNSKKNIIKVKKLNVISKEYNRIIYGAILDIELDDDPKLVEDLPFVLKIGGIQKDSKVLDFDRLSETLYFNHPEDLTKFYGQIRVEVDASWILLKIKERLTLVSKEFNSNSSSHSNELISKFMQNRVVPNNLPSLAKIPDQYGNLDESQKEALKFAYKNDITLIWGPPGTGKSHTLASIINSFYKKRERTLIVCIANVAVDSITSKFVDLLEKEKIQPSQGEVLRIGYTKNERLIKTKFLFPDNEFIDEIRKQIIEINEILKDKNKDRKDIIQYKSKKQDLQDALKDATNNLIRRSNTVFATTSKFFIEENLYDTEFENLVIDEASMLSIPQFLGLASKIKKRIIITGDFRQLGPVVLSDSHLAKKWLNRDVFEFSGINPKNETFAHPCLKQLLIQRRSNEEICSLINKPFYQGKLQTKQIDQNIILINQSPSKDLILSYYNMKGSTVQFTKQGSRYNEVSASFIMGLLKEISLGDISNQGIGIITPYRGQVKLLNSLISQSSLDQSVKNILRVGTIHAFQGSEEDLIIFDTVDTINKNIGKLYFFETGERLLNVALSRAKHKLIIVGDLDVFLNGKGKSNINLSVYRIFEKLKKFEVKID